jgi:hypothetical protein
MPKSQNGWPVIESQSDRNLTVIRIPGTGTPGIPLRVQKDCAPLLAYVASRVHTDITDLRKGNKPGKTQDEGGYNYRKIGGSSSFSNHASGTAIDLNWQLFPMFKRRMNKKQREAALAIEAELSEVIRWGGSYRPSRVDEMHWEIKDGVTKAEVKAFIKAKGIRKDGTISKTTKSSAAMCMVPGRN